MKIYLKYLRGIKIIFFRTFFLFFNFYGFLKIKKIMSSVKEEIVLSGLNHNDIQEFICIYENLNKPQKMDFINLFLLKIFGSRACFIAKDLCSNKIIAIDFFYFNWRDIYEKSIHEAFIGVIDTYQRKGIATNIRKFALQHFSDSNINAVSTRISNNNVPSFKSAKNLGFEIQEEYFDDLSNEVRFYLKCDLRSKTNRN